MGITRRYFLKLSLGIGLIAFSGYLFKTIFWPSRITAGETKTLTAYLDTLIPADTSPGAVQLGVAEKIISSSHKERKYRRLLKKGCVWLDSKARSHNAADFSLLDQRARSEIVGIASNERADQLPNIFFERTRFDAFSHFYAHPDSWTSLGYDGPPQPYGFPDYTQPPSNTGYEA